VCGSKQEHSSGVRSVVLKAMTLEIIVLFGVALWILVDK
jgi:hypothetical protein